MEAVGGFAWKAETNLGFEEAIEKVTGYLQEEGFGILTEIDVTATLKKKLDLDYKPFRILGACNPPFAHKALEADHLVGVLMPCNVVVWDEGDYRVVAAMNPGMMTEMIKAPQLKELTATINEKIQKVLDKVEQD